MSDSKQELVLEVLKRIEQKHDDTRDCLNSLDKKLDLHIQKTQYELDHINRLDEQQNRLLDEHIAGVQTLKKMYEAHERADIERFQKLEEPRKLINLLIKVIIVFGSAAGALATVSQFWK